MIIIVYLLQQNQALLVYLDEVRVSSGWASNIKHFDTSNMQFVQVFADDIMICAENRQQVGDFRQVEVGTWRKKNESKL